VAQLAKEITKLNETEPKYYQEIAQRFGDHEFQLVARALGKLHADEKLWQDARGRMCLSGSAFAAKPPATASE
jgi:2,5-furandicarboxylate decarboxylase 1